ncbi:hypothetical protein LP420_34970 [Massilia sp. B-10]|nr:hypothetical protein LP420_34970 [Massilia sp. B-10]
MRVLNKLFSILVSIGLFGTMASCFASDSSQTDEVVSFYARVHYPSLAESQALQELAMKQGDDFHGILHELPEETTAWTKIFAVSLQFKEFDRPAQVYGFTLFSAFAYFVDGAGEAKFAKLIDAQPPKVRQRIRDFLYYDVVNDDPNVMKNNERLVRRNFRRVFPRSYVFDPSFGLSRH